MKHNNLSKDSRRTFLAKMGFMLGTSGALTSLGSAKANSFNFPHAKMTVQQVIDLILTTIPGAPFKETVDTLKSGDGQQEVKGIVSTMFATVEVIRQSAALGANFIIAHEPTFYNHRDDVAWLEGDQVFQFKNELLKKNIPIKHTTTIFPLLNGSAVL